MSSPIEIIETSWPEPVPDWVRVLATECAAASQNQVATRLGRSAALISQVLRNKYRGDMAAVEELVRGKFMNATIACPALGDIPSHECQGWRAKSRTVGTANSLRVRMYRACNKCPRNGGNHDG